MNGALTVSALAALTGAFFFALAAALQQREALSVAADGVADVRLLWRLAHRPLWLIGILADVLAAVLHAVALGFGSIALVQPLGVTGLLFAIPLVAMLRRQRIPPRDLAAAAVVLAGLVGVLRVFPATTDSAVAGPGGITALVGVTLGVGVICIGLAALAPGRPRALLLAGASGIAFGVTAVLVRATLQLTGRPHATSAPVLAVVGVLLLIGGGYLCLQNAYRAGHFAGSLAMAVVIDPIAAILGGLNLLGEPGPRPGQSVIIVVSAVAIIGGIALLVASPANLLALPPSDDAKEPGQHDAVA